MPFNKHSLVSVDCCSEFDCAHWDDWPLLHPLVLVCVPLPHVCEHSDQLPHKDHCGTKNIKLFYSKKSIRFEILYNFLKMCNLSNWRRGHRGRDSMVIGFTTTYVISGYHLNVVSFNPVHGEVYSIQDYEIKSVVFSRYSGFLLQIN